MKILVNENQNNLKTEVGRFINIGGKSYKVSKYDLVNRWVLISEPAAEYAIGAGFDSLEDFMSQNGLDDEVEDMIIPKLVYTMIDLDDFDNVSPVIGVSWLRSAKYSYFGMHNDNMNSNFIGMIKALAGGLDRKVDHMEVPAV